MAERRWLAHVITTKHEQICDLTEAIDGEDSENIPLTLAWESITRDANSELQRFGALEPEQAKALIAEHHKLLAEIAAMRTTLNAVCGSGWHEDVEWEVT